MKLIVISMIFILSYSFSSAQLFEQFTKEVSKELLREDSELKFTKDEAGKAIKEALEQGAGKAASLVSKEDGFFKNQDIKIPFPNDAKRVEKTLRKAGLGKEVDRAVLSINRSAELASKEAKKVLVGAIKGMTLTDAVKIVKGKDNAATVYLQENTSEELTTKFKPIIEEALKKTDATKHWKSVMSSYNKIPFVKKVNPDLTDYVTQKTLEGLFVMIAKEELEIREDPVARTTDLLKKVFG